MLMKVKTIEMPKNFGRRPNGIVLTRKHIQDLNNRILKDIQQNEMERESGLDIAARCRMK